MSVIVGTMDTCKNCGKALEFGIPKILPTEMKYSRFKPTEPYWYHSYTRRVSCPGGYARPFR